MDNQSTWTTLSLLKEKPKLEWKLEGLIILLVGIGITDTVLLLNSHFYSQGECQNLPLGLNRLSYILSFLGSDCGTVTTSSYGFLAGFPLSIWGFIGYTLILAFTLLSINHKPYFWITTILAGFGAITSWTLTWIQSTFIGAFCPLCILSTIIMSLIFIISIIGIFLYQPNFPKTRQLVIIILLSGLIITSGLLTYKIIQDIIDSPPLLKSNKVSSPTSRINNNFPAGIVEGKIIHLKDIDQILKENISPIHQLALNEDSLYFNQIWKELRYRGLHLLAIKHWAEMEDKDPSYIIDKWEESSIQRNKTTWDEFIMTYLSLDDIIKDTQNNKTQITSLIPSPPQNINMIIEKLKSQVDIKENIPPTEQFKPY